MIAVQFHLDRPLRRRLRPLTSWFNRTDKLAFGGGLVGGEQEFGDAEAEHAVAEKFQPLVIAALAPTRALEWVMARSSRSLVVEAIADELPACSRSSGEMTDFRLI
jgi:hypothetical protein